MFVGDAEVRDFVAQIARFEKKTPLHLEEGRISVFYWCGAIVPIGDEALLLDIGAMSDDVDIDDEVIEDIGIDDDIDEDDIEPLVFLCFFLAILDMLLLDMLSEDIEVPWPGRS